MVILDRALYSHPLCCARITRDQPNRQLSEPFAAIRQPPTEGEQGNRGANGPPERQKQIDRKTQYRESSPKNLALHGFSLT
jgi:hypothetical protein